MKLLTALLLCASLTTGCKLTTVQPTDLGSTSVFHSVSRKELFDTTAKVMAEKLTVIEQDQARGTIQAERNIWIPTWGERVGAFITELSDGGIQLKVVSKKRIQWQWFRKNWSPAILNGVDIELKSQD